MNPNDIINLAMNNSQMMQNPIFRNAVSMYQRNDLNGLKSLAENLCREKNISPQDILNRYMKK